MTRIQDVYIPTVIADLYPDAEIIWRGGAHPGDDMTALDWQYRSDPKPTARQVIDHYDFMQSRDAGIPTQETVRQHLSDLAEDDDVPIDLSQLRGLSDFQRLVLRRLKRLEDAAN